MKDRFKNDITVRRADVTDLGDLRELFRKSVLHIAGDFYSDAQLNAWATVAGDKEKWNRKFESQLFFVAESAGRILGFVSFEMGGYLDFLYVHPDYQRQGVASEMLMFIEDYAVSHSIKEIQVDASFVAYRFFRQNGFVVLNKRTVEVNNVSMINFAMHKILDNENKPADG